VEARTPQAVEREREAQRRLLKDNARNQASNATEITISREGLFVLFPTLSNKPPRSENYPSVLCSARSLDFTSPSLFDADEFLCRSIRPAGLSI